MNFNFEIVCDKPKNQMKSVCVINWFWREREKKNKMNIRCEKWAKHIVVVYKIQMNGIVWNDKCCFGFCCETYIQMFTV